MRALSKSELDLVAGGTSSSDYYPGSSGVWYESGGGGGGGGGGTIGMWLWFAVEAQIYVDGVLDAYGPVGYWQYLTFESTDDGSGGGGSNTGGSIASNVFEHTEDCSTEDGAAVQVAKNVIGSLPAGVSGPPNPLETDTGRDWTSVEFGAIIVNNGNGTYGAYNDQIYSDDSVTGVNMSFAAGTDVVGIWHSHPENGSNYPSDSTNLGENDWDELQRLKEVVAPNDPTYDPSLWITGPDGITREFKLSQRSYFEGLTDPQKAAGVGLDGTQRTSSCS